MTHAEYYTRRKSYVRRLLHRPKITHADLTHTENDVRRSYTHRKLHTPILHIPKITYAEIFFGVCNILAQIIFCAEIFGVCNI